MSKNSTLLFCSNEKDEKQKFRDDAFRRVVAVQQDTTNSISVIHGLFKENIEGNYSPNISMSLGAHGASGNFSFKGEPALHPAEILQRAVAESPQPILSHVNLDLFGCQVGAGVVKDRNDKQFPDPADRNKKILYERNEQYYKDHLPQNSSVILNGGNKKILVSFGKYLLEDLQLEVRRGGVLNEDSSAFDKVLFKIFQSPNTVKLAYKDKEGKTHFFKSSAIKPLSKADTNPENIKRHMLNEMKKFVDWSKDLVTPQEHAQLQNNLLQLEKRVTAEHLKNYGDISLSLETVRGKTKYAQHYFDNGYKFIASPADQNKDGSSDRGLFKYALRDSKEGKEFLFKNLDELNRREKNVLLIAAIGGQFEEYGVDIIDKLISSPSFDPNSHHPSLGTPLGKAISNGDEKLVRRLVAAGAKIDQLSVDENGKIFYSPLYSAIIGANFEIVRSLLESKLFNDLNGDNNPNSSSPLIHTILKCPKKEERLKILEMLLIKGCDPNYDNKANTFGFPLMIAIQEKDAGAVRMLVKYKADLNLVTRYGTPLIAAIKDGNQDMIELLKELRADMNLKTQFGTPLGKAIELGNLATTKLLIKLGAKVTIDDLEMAKGNPQIAQMLHDAKAQQDTVPIIPQVKPAKIDVKPAATITSKVEVVKPEVEVAKPKTTKPEKAAPIITVAEKPILTEKIPPAPSSAASVESTKSKIPLQPKSPLPDQVQSISRPKSPLLRTRPVEVITEQIEFAREAQDKETGQEKRHISITKNDFRDESGQRIKSANSEDRQKITPQDFSLAISEDQQHLELKGSILKNYTESSNKFELDFAEFGGLEFVEKSGDAKFFGNGSQLKNSSFRNCILDGVDFSGFSAENFKTLILVGCKLQNCLLPTGIKMAEERDANGVTILRGVDAKTTTPTEYSNMQVATPQRPKSATSRRGDADRAMAQQLSATFAEVER